MREIGVRELKARLSEVLRRVAAGEPVRVTVHNRPVADIVPVGAPESDARIRDLIAQGRLVPPSRPRPDRAPPPARSKRSASELVLADREADR
jgi:prevent-host-death family protein